MSRDPGVHPRAVGTDSAICQHAPGEGGSEAEVCTYRNREGSSDPQLGTHLPGDPAEDSADHPPLPQNGVVRLPELLAESLVLGVLSAGGSWRMSTDGLGDLQGPVSSFVPSL